MNTSGMPSAFAASEAAADAWTDGRSSADRAQDLADGSAQTDETDVPWHKRTPAPGATYPPMGERQG